MCCSCLGSNGQNEEKEAKGGEEREGRARHMIYYFIVVAHSQNFSKVGAPAMFFRFSLSACFVHIKERLKTREWKTGVE